MDRSALVRHPTDRTAEHVTSGRLVVRQAEPSGRGPHEVSADVASTLDVDVLWTTDAAAELAASRRVLGPGGRLLLLPGSDRPTDAAHRLRRPGRGPTSATWRDTATRGDFGVSADAPPARPDPLVVTLPALPDSARPTAD